MSISRRNFLGLVGKLALGGAVMTSSLYSSPSFADTVYYGGNVKGKKVPAYIIYDSVKEQSKYKLPEKNNSEYDKILGKRTESISSAISSYASGNGYDVVVEKSDPVIDGYKDITQGVVGKLKELEK